MNRRPYLVVAILLFCIFSYVSLAAAASTSFSIYVDNKSNSTKKLKKGNDLGGTENLAANDGRRFSTTDTAWYLKTKKYKHNIEVKNNGSSYCKCEIWLKNEVTFFGNTKITDDDYSSNNDSRCKLKRDNTAGNDDLSLSLTIN